MCWVAHLYSLERVFLYKHYLIILKPAIRLTNFSTIFQQFAGNKRQHYWSRRSMAIIVLVARNNLLETLRPLMPDVLYTLQTIQPGDIVHIGTR